MNLIIIVIDTLRYDHIGAHGNDWIETPNIDALAAQSWVFDRCMAASFPTIPHRTDTITGRYGGPFHVWQPLPYVVPTLPMVLADYGYCSQLIHDTPHLVNGGHHFDWPFHAWTFVRGAEVDRPWIDAGDEPLDNWARDPVFDFMGENMRPRGNLLTYERANRKRRKPEDWNAARLFLTASDWLEDNRSRDNFLLWVDCFDPHEPWDAPPEFAKLYDDDPDWDGRVDPRSFGPLGATADMPEAAIRRVQALYAAKVSLVDHWFGRFWSKLNETGLADRTAVLLTSDHGTNLGERGYFHKRAPVWQQEAHVPFILRVPGAGCGRSDIMLQPQDIFATMMAAAGRQCPAHLDSQDVLAAAQGRETPRRQLAATGISADSWPGSEGGILFTVFDKEWALQVAADPANCRLNRLGSVEDVAGAHPAVVDSLRDAGLAEIDRRGADPRLMAWIRNGARGGLPQGCRPHDHWPRPPGYFQYFHKIYRGP